MNRILRVNMHNKTITEEVFDNSILFGNRGLVAKVISEEVDPQCNPLGPDNKLVFATGLLAGTGISTTGRLSVGTKSPLTGTIKEANVGGNAGAQMITHGIKMIIFEDQPAEGDWNVFRIDQFGTASLEDGNAFQNFGTYETTEKLKELYGPKSAVCVIGIGGEKRLTAASIQVTDNSTGHPTRAAARGGVGAVMGSKGIKAILLEKPKKRVKLEPANKALLTESKTAITKMIQADPTTGVGLSLLGTMAYMDVTPEINVLPKKNFGGEMLSAEQREAIGANTFAARANSFGGRAGVACQPGCIIRCSNIVNDKNGRMITSGLEYETAALFGPNCDIYDYDFLANMDRLCDDFGVDTIDVADGIAVAMDAGVIEWGDQEATYRLMEEMRTASTPLGEALGQGTAAVGRLLGHHRVPTVKNQSLPAYDPRNLQGIGVEYATFPGGADHTGGHPLGENIDHTKPQGQVELLKQLQASTAICDNTMCLFAMLALASPEGLTLVAQAIEGAYGHPCDLERLMEIGSETVRMERKFNLEAGISLDADNLPDFFRTEPNASGNTFDVSTDELKNMWA